MTVDQTGPAGQEDHFQQGSLPFDRWRQGRAIEKAKLPARVEVNSRSERPQRVAAKAMRAVLKCFDSHARRKPTCTLKIQTISEETNISEQHLARVLKALEQEYLIGREKRSGEGGRRAASVYRIIWSNLEALCPAGTFEDTPGPTSHGACPDSHSACPDSHSAAPNSHCEGTLNHSSKRKENHKDETLSPRQNQAEQLYAIYPRKVGKGAAIKSIERALETVAFESLKEAVEAFAQSPAGQLAGTQRRFIPYPATWLNQGRWTDDRCEWDGARVDRRQPYENFLNKGQT
jgi:AraC-like DNA-binding protein